VVGQGRPQGPHRKGPRAGLFRPLRRGRTSRPRRPRSGSAGPRSPADPWPQPFSPEQTRRRQSRPGKSRPAGRSPLRLPRCHAPARPHGRWHPRASYFPGTHPDPRRPRQCHRLRLFSHCGRPRPHRRPRRRRPRTGLHPQRARKNLFREGNLPGRLLRRCRHPSHRGRGPDVPPPR